MWLTNCDNEEVALDLPPETNLSDTTTSSVESILYQTDAHYILQMTNDSVTVQAMTSVCFIFVRAQNAKFQCFMDAEKCVHYESSFVT